VVEDFRKCATSRVPAVALLREVANFKPAVIRWPRATRFPVAADRTAFVGRKRHVLQRVWGESFEGSLS
jgi:hypothetical protein